MNAKRPNPEPRAVPRFALPLLFALLAAPAAASTPNGNDFALYLTEAQTPAAAQVLVSEATGRPHFFRYLQVIEMDAVYTNGIDAVRIKAFEPSSYMDVSFTVSKPVSLRILRESPATQPGAAIAVTAKVNAVDIAGNTIFLDAVIVRHKDRLSPARGKELICEVDPRATFYSYTGGKQIVNLTYKDRDLIRHKDRIVSERGKQGWADFLTAELTKRNAARAAEEARTQKAGERKP